MIIPERIDIELADKEGKANPIENVLLGLKIFAPEGSWHNYSAFKSNALGQITLTQQNIIENTELKWEENFLSGTTTKFELYVWNGQDITDTIKATQQLLEFYKDENIIREYLKEQRVLEVNIPVAIEIIKNKAIEDKAFYTCIENSVNSSIHADPIKITGVWKDSLPKTYRFIIQEIKREK